MALPTLPKKEPRPVAVTVRLSRRTADLLRDLSKKHNMSQADIIEYLIRQEVTNTAQVKRTRVNSEPKD